MTGHTLLDRLWAKPAEAVTDTWRVEATTDTRHNLSVPANLLAQHLP